MVDSLNAEVSLGTIANVQEAIQWLGYTYLFGQTSSPFRLDTPETNITLVRMRKEPFIYGKSTIYGACTRLTWSRHAPQ